MERIGELLESLTSNEKFASPLTGTNTFSIAQQSLFVDSPFLSSVPSIWSNVRLQLERELGGPLYSAWIAPLVLETLEKSLGKPGDLSSRTVEYIATIVSPNRFSSEHVERNYAQVLRETFASLGYKHVHLVFKLGNPKFNKSLHHQSEHQLSQKPEHDSPRNIDRSRSALNSQRINREEVRGEKISREKEKVDTERKDQSSLNPKYNFSNFVVGSCNQLAHAVGLKISESLGQAYNPLFLYGGVGLGKTHLANAIGNSARRRQKRVLLVSSESFVSELIASLRGNRMEQFKNKFRSLDLLIIDDIQFIIGKERTQEEFFHTFNELYNRHKQIVITSDKVPRELVGLEDRLKTRFASGLSVDLQAPDFETRVAILVKKAEIEGLEIPQDVARLIAERIDSNVRELEGALNQLRAYSLLQKTPITLSLAEDVLKNFGKRRSLEITSETIQRAVAEKFNVSFNDLLGKRRTQNIALARQVAMYLCRKLTAYSFPEIGAFFGGRDHSTVIHAQKIITDRLHSDPQIRTEVLSLEQKFRGL